MKKNKKPSPWNERIAEAIKEGQTFDLDSDNGGFPTIHWLIAKFMLQRYSEFEEIQLMGHYVGKIKNNLQHAINSLKDQGISVWIKRPFGIKTIQAISTDDKYRQEDAIRMKSHWAEATIRGLENIEEKHPNLLPGNLGRRFRRAIEDTRQLPLLQ